MVGTSGVMFNDIWEMQHGDDVLLRASRSLRDSSSFYRLYSIRRSPPAATSTSAAQPFSTPFTPSPSKSTDPTSTSSQPPVTPKSSSLKAGTPLKGLAFLKNREPPVAKEDHEYPDWLWGILDQGKFGTKGAEEGGGEGDLFSKSAKQRRIAARAARRSASTTSTVEVQAPPVPLHEQSIDLPSAPQNRFGREVDMEAAVKAREAREELTASLRAKRRKSIKEDNFLRSMK
ncbi:MAG: hypothetical protein L6R41_000408 [Letrouitia leprolyta]|nr:MAG: hypothetical protein L6R41_000408 [Letrouitia leprolyta]